MASHDVPDTPAFLEARRILAPQLPEALRSLSLAQTVEVFREKVYAYPTDHPLRDFARKYLGMRNEQSSRVREWLNNPSCINASEAELMLQTLTKETKTRTHTASVVTSASATDVNQQSQVAEDRNPATRRKIVEHSLTMLNSTTSLLEVAGITSADMFDSDRMYVQRAMAKLSARFGIEATFAVPSESLNQPLTKGELANFNRQQHKDKR